MQLIGKPIILLLICSCIVVVGNTTAIDTDYESMSSASGEIVDISPDDSKRIAGIVDFCVAQTILDPVDKVDYLLKSLKADPKAEIPLRQLLFFFRQPGLLRHGLQKLRDIAIEHPTALTINLSVLVLSPPEDRDKAITVAERCVRSNNSTKLSDSQWPVFANIIEALARLYRQAGAFARGDQLFDEVLYNVEDKAPEELIASVALFYADASKKSTKSDYYRKKKKRYFKIVEAATFDPTDRKELAKRSAFYEQMGYFDTAETLLLRRMLQQPMDMPLRIMLVNLYFRQRKYYLATMVWQSVIRDFHAQPIIYLNLGRIAWQAGLIQVAYNAFQHFLNAGFAPRDAGYLPALVMLEHNLPEQALRFLEQLPVTTTTLRLRASALGRKGRYHDALALMVEAIKKNKKNGVDFGKHDRLFGLYLLFLAEKCKDRDAVVCAGNYLLKNQNNFADDSEMANAIGYTFAVVNYRLKQAEDLVTAALSKAPDNAEYLDTMAWILFKKNDFIGAEKYIKKALTHAGCYPHAVIADHAGDIFSAVGKCDKALKYRRLALQVYSDEIDRTKLEAKISCAVNKLMKEK